jgi:RNA polymerase sigma factor (sigma-70 family)
MTYTDQTFYDAVAGDPKAVDLTLRQFEPLVHKFARRYLYMGQEHMYEDFVQEGMIGILKAIKTFDLEYRYKGKAIRPMTWIFPNVRAAIQGVARPEMKNPKYSLSLEQSDWGNNLEDLNSYELKEEFSQIDIEALVKDGCGPLDSKRAQIVCDRFGLLGRKPMRQGEVAQKYGLSKQATNGHIARFSKKIKEKHPHLKDLL